MKTRRSFLSSVVGALAALTAPARPQKAIMEGQTAVICDSDSTVCPNGHKTCKVINKPIVIGNDREDYPDVHQLFEYKFLRCDQCKVVFTDK